MSKDLETAAQERALAMHLASIVGMYFPREVETHFNSGFLAGAAHNQKRIEELEGQLAEIKSYMPKVPTEPYEKELAKALTKERQISKMLEEALEFECGGRCAEWINPCNAREALAEVQKLRSE